MLKYLNLNTMLHYNCFCYVKCTNYMCENVVSKLDKHNL